MLPPFPVDDTTLSMLMAAIEPDPKVSDRSSLWDCLELYSELGGSDTKAIESEDAYMTVMRDPCYHVNDVIASLIAEVRRLRDQLIEEK